jgi:hypothetical protein
LITRPGQVTGDIRSPRRQQNFGIDQLLRTTLHVIDSVKTTPFHGTAYMFEHLETQFMNAAGMKPLAVAPV